MRTPSSSEAMTPVQAIADRVVTNVEKVIVGKHREVQLTLVALLCRGHVLIEDVPGVGKTVLAKTIARSIGCTFKRIQFTPDLLPGDVTGVSIFNQGTRVFEFRPGPVVAQIVLADEINRATPKTQSALLEAMEERQITVDGETHDLPMPFVVLATQNPIEYEGTFPLPEAQLDRFLLRISLGYPAHMEEISVLQNQMSGHPLSRIEQVVDVERTDRGAAVHPRHRPRGSADPRIHGLDGRGDAAARRDLSRRQPARRARPARVLAGVGGARRARLRAAGRCQGARGAGARRTG